MRQALLANDKVALLAWKTHNHPIFTSQLIETLIQAGAQHSIEWIYNLDENENFLLDQVIPLACQYKQVEILSFADVH